MRVHYDRQNRKTERFNPKCQGLISTAVARLPPPQSAALAWAELKVLNIVKKGEKKETLHIPLHSPFREMFNAYFRLNAHGLYFPYCALTCCVESLFVLVPDSPTESDTKSVKKRESFQEPLER